MLDFGRRFLPWGTLEVDEMIWVVELWVAKVLEMLEKRVQQPAPEKVLKLEAVLQAEVVTGNM